MKSDTPSGEETASKAFSARIHGTIQTTNSCAFCWFVLALYPTLKRMTEKDSAMFSQHLKKAHALCEEIQP